MPELTIIRSMAKTPKLQDFTFGSLAINLVKDVSQVFGVGEGDVGVTYVAAIDTSVDADVQVEVKYSASDDFRPTPEKRQELKAKLLETMSSMLQGEIKTVSAWIIPFEGATYDTVTLS